MVRILPPPCQRTGLSMNVKSPRVPVHSSMASRGEKDRERVHRFEKSVSPTADTIEHQKLLGLGRGVDLVDDGERLGALNVGLVLRWGEAGLQGMHVTPEGFVACFGDVAGAAEQLPVACLVPAALL